MTATRQPGRQASGRPRLDRATVVRAARDLLDDEGAAGLTMARLGERLGVTAMALYRHVEDRGELVEAVVALVLDSIDTGGEPPPDWEQGVSRWMRTIRAHLLRHPWVTGLMGSPRDVSPPWLAALDQLRAALEHTGLPDAVVAREIVRISRVTVGIALQEVRAPLPHAAANAERMLAGLAPDTRPRWTTIVDELAHYDNDDLFDDIVFDAVDRLRRQGAVTIEAVP